MGYSKEEIEDQLRVISEKAKIVFTEYIDLGDGSVKLVSENSHIRISKHDLEGIMERHYLYNIKKK